MAASTDESVVRRKSTGRPTPEQQRDRLEALLAAALDIFLEKGFDQTTTDEIASAVGMSKRTVYAKFADKEALFRAAVERAIERFTIAPAVLVAVAVDDIEQTLRSVAQLRIANATTPVAIKLNRILAAQAYRFPDLPRRAFERAVAPSIASLAALFADRTSRGDLTIAEPERAATAFLSLVVGGTARAVTAGTIFDEQEISRRIDFAVTLFLNGARPR